MKTEITFYGGLRTIGGVVMSITYGTNRLLLEIGTACAPDEDYFNSNFTLDTKFQTYQAVKLHSIPPVPGLYAKDQLKDLSLLANEDSSLKTSIFITHLHLDHMSAIGYPSDNVDIYMGEPAQKLFHLLQEVEPVFYQRTKPFLPIFDKQPVSLGEIKVTPYLLNTEGYQDWSFYIETPDLKLHYTGDLILHSTYADRVLAEMKEIANKHIDILVSECTSLMEGIFKTIYGTSTPKIVSSSETPKGMLSQKEWLQASGKRVQEAKGAFFFNFYRRELHMYPYYFEWAKKANRQLVLEPQSAYLYTQFFHKPCVTYLPNNDYYANNQESWFQKTIRQCPIIKLKDILNNPDNYIVQVSFSNLTTLVDYQGIQGVYYHGDGEPIGAFDRRYQQVVDYVNSLGFNFTELFPSNYFSHCYPSGLYYYADSLKAKYLIPTHGFNPDLLVGKDSIQFLPQLDCTYIWNNGKLEEKACK